MAYEKGREYPGEHPRYDRSDPRGGTTLRKPNWTRLQIAYEIGNEQMRASDWLYDGKVFRCSPEDNPHRQIGNLIGFMANLAGFQHSGLMLQPMTAGIPVATTPMVMSMLANPNAISWTPMPEARWFVDNVCYRDGPVETFGWNAVSEYFSLGMWDARRIFQGYAYPETPTLESTLRYLRSFIDNRVKIE